MVLNKLTAKTTVWEVFGKFIAAIIYLGNLAVVPLENNALSSKTSPDD